VDGAARGADVFFWEEATGRRRWAAASLVVYIGERFDGTLPRTAPSP
jgi:hypothetical protein